MPMLIKGSCRCAAVRFEVASHTPVPYQLCYCSICRKQQGGGGFAINLGANSTHSKSTGKRDLGLYRAEIEDDERPACEISSGERRFLPEMRLGTLALRSALAGAGASVRLGSRQRVAGRARAGPPHAEIQGVMGRARHPARATGPSSLYPEESIADWHKRHGLWVE